MNTNYEEILKQYQIQKSADFTLFQNTGEKILGQITKVLKYQQFNASFERFTEKMQRFFLEEFKMVVNIYY